MGAITKNFVIDTNILIYHLNDVLNEQAEQLLETALTHHSYISVITRIEVLGWKSHTPILSKMLKICWPVLMNVR